MILLCNEPMRRVLDKLNVQYHVNTQLEIKDYAFVEAEEGIFYLEAREGAVTDALFLKISREEIWKVDKLQNSFRYYRKELDCFHKPVMAYLKRNQGFAAPQAENVEDMARYLQKTRQLETSDIYLMIPGKLEQNKTSGKDTWDKLNHVSQDVFDIFNENIQSCIRAEYHYNFADTLQRKCLGEVIIEIPCDYVEQQKFRQSALVEIVRHETGLCILEIFVYNCSIGGNKLLNYYCSDELIYEFQGQRYELCELLKLWHIRPYGKKRSMVFAYGDVSDEAILNALVNEEYPMGKVGGVFSDILKNQNVAQYDTAEVFVSSVTMLEHCKSLEKASELILDHRIAYHAIEIFFVELLLFQDASIDKIYLDVKKEQKLQETETDMELALERYEQIGFDMGKAMQFSDYEQFVFPTTRVSARKIAQSFGIDRMFEKYEANRHILEDMIRSNKRQMEYKQDQLKNAFLLIISGLTLLGTLGESLYNIFESTQSGVMGYGLAIILIAAGFCIYELILYLYHKKIKKVRKGDK